VNAAYNSALVGFALKVVKTDFHAASYDAVNL
jgi:hypothetical protein